MRSTPVVVSDMCITNSIRSKSCPRCRRPKIEWNAYERHLGGQFGEIKDNRGTIERCVADTVVIPCLRGQSIAMVAGVMTCAIVAHWLGLRRLDATLSGSAQGGPSAIRD